MSFKKQIEAGATLLDEKVPGWEEKIDLEDLDLRDTCDCVMGQAFPDKSYIGALQDLFGEDTEGNDVIEKSRVYGFSADDPYDYPALTNQWKTYITNRKVKKNEK